MNVNDQKGDPIETLSKPQLLEQLDRQTKLLQNRKFLEKLPDKGQKIHQHVQRLQQLLAEREQMEDAMEKFSKLSLRTLAHDQRNGVQDEDMMEDSAQKTMSKFKQSASKKTSFKTNVPKNPKHEERQSLSETWNYQSAITNPKTKFTSAKTLSVNESIKLQQDQTKLVQELETEKAAQRLWEYKGSDDHTSAARIVSNPYKYRDRGEFDPLESESSGTEEMDDDQEGLEEDIIN